MQDSLTYYRKALDLTPDYRPAHEYLGELYVETGGRTRPGDELAALGKLCPDGCEERSDLEKVLSARGIAKEVAKAD